MWILPCHGVSHAHGMRPVHLLGGLLQLLRLPGCLLLPCLRGLAVFLHVLPPGLPVRRTQVVASDRMHFAAIVAQRRPVQARSEEHTSELQSLMRISYAVFCLKKKNKT